MADYQSNTICTGVAVWGHCTIKHRDLLGEEQGNLILFSGCKQQLVLYVLRCSPPVLWSAEHVELCARLTSFPYCSQATLFD